MREHLDLRFTMSRAKISSMTSTLFSSLIELLLPFLVDTRELAVRSTTGRPDWRIGYPSWPGRDKRTEDPGRLGGSSS